MAASSRLFFLWIWLYWIANWRVFNDTRYVPIDVLQYSCTLREEYYCEFPYFVDTLRSQRTRFLCGGQSLLFLFWLQYEYFLSWCPSWAVFLAPNLTWHSFSWTWTSISCTISSTGNWYIQCYLQGLRSAAGWRRPLRSRKEEYNRCEGGRKKRPMIWCN